MSNKHLILYIVTCVGAGCATVPAISQQEPWLFQGESWFVAGWLYRATLSHMQRHLERK